MFGEACHDMAYEKQLAKEEYERSMKEQEKNMVRPADTMGIANFVERTARNIQEADAVISEIMCNLVGPDKGTRAEMPPADCLRTEAARNAENSVLLLEKLLRLKDCLFG